jgi:hypothetical protein
VLRTLLEPSSAQPDWPIAGSGKLNFSRRQWFLAFLLFLMMVMNYLDREALSVVAPVMRKELGISMMGAPMPSTRSGLAPEKATPITWPK